ncbi:uncharacterized protein [Nicotiana tomentosiformis]|uniref:uncharacterized protein n=1 Tax=Nicotiana tomentosiformis TaxID=4098 RepID=UPI00388CA986
MTWDQFTRLFLDRYIPPSQREELQCQFERLEQGQMSVTEYEVRFSELSRHALMILSTEAERVHRFVVGLHSSIQDSMAREVEMGTPYQLVVEISRKIESYRQRGLEQMQRDKRYYRPLAIQISSSGYSGHQVSSNAYISAIQESSYHPLVIQDSSRGYSGHRGLTSG